MPRTPTIYVTTDAFFSPRGKVLHGFDQFLAEAAQAQMPCVWMTAWTRAQLDEPRRRLGQNDPYIGENGCGVYLPEDYFHLKGSSTIRLGRYTCIPVAKPQPAAAEALEALSSELDISVVPLRSLSHRELSQNTGLPAREAELIRMRDFDEFFFFAGAPDEDITKFRAEAKARGLAVQKAGAFWSLSNGGDMARCVRELGGLYDRALRSHARRIGVRVIDNEEGKENTERDFWPNGAFDRTLVLKTRAERMGAERVAGESEVASDIDEEPRKGGNKVEPNDHSTRRSRFHLNAPDVWESVMAAISPSGEQTR